MTIYAVIRKSDGREVFRYVADAPVAWPGMEFDAFDHAEYSDTVIDSQPQASGGILTRRGFIKRFTVSEYAAIKTAAQSNDTVDYYWQMFCLAEEIDTNDPDTVAGMTMLEQAGLIGPGRATEVLSGS